MTWRKNFETTWGWYVYRYTNRTVIRRKAADKHGEDGCQSKTVMTILCVNFNVSEISKMVG